MGDDRAIGYREDNNSIYRASGSGSCVRAIVAAMQGYEENRSQFAGRVMDTAATEGNLHEGAIVEALKEQGWKVKGSVRESSSVSTLTGSAGHREPGKIAS